MKLSLPPGRLLTVAVVAALVLSAAGWDLFAYKHYGNAATESDTVLDWSLETPVVPGVIGLTVGVLAGHFWLWVQTGYSYPRLTKGLVIALVTVTASLTVQAWTYLTAAPFVAFLAWSCTGVVVGAVFVPQHRVPMIFPLRGSKMTTKASDYLTCQPVDDRHTLTAEPGVLAPTPADILGPFFREGMPERTNLVPDPYFLPGTLPRVHLIGKVKGIDGNALFAATVEVWQADENGNYDYTGPDYWFYGQQKVIDDYTAIASYRVDTIVPGDYKISDPGTPDVFRCAHIHFKVSCPGYKTLVTQLYFPGDRYNATDAWFQSGHGEKRLLARDESGNCTFDFVLARE